ncbi:MAG: dihydropteroate synthase, partial [Rickettsiales bacterium]
DMPFYNMAIAGETSLSPHKLLAAIKGIEEKLGRNKIGHWSPRNIDIDILTMGDVVIDTADLSIPHKELLNRDFALNPLLELAPYWVHPFAKKKAAKFIGIINITPDSFSDGGENYTPASALRNIRHLLDDGVDVIDIGAESTRPNAIPISHDDEWARLEPVLADLKFLSVPVSVDTRHAKTARKALALGVDWINDVSGFTNPEMVASVRDSDCKLVVMHSLTVPADKNIILPLDVDPVELLVDWANSRFADLEKAGISRDRIIFDAGIGFGKNAEQSHSIIKNIARFKILGVPILIGHSRKSFLGKGAGDDATLEISQFLSDNGVDYLRVHNVKRHKLEIK